MAFTLRGKRWYQYVWLILPPIVIGISLSAFVLVWRTYGMKRRRLWALVTLICGPIIALNWATGFVAVRPISVLLLGFGMSKAGPVAPWIISLGFPIGAIVALSRRAAWLRGADSRDDSAPAA